MAHQYIYVMKDLKKVVPPKREILKGIWLSFYPGAKIGVIGGNGAGKSTLLRIMAGVDREFLGEAWPAEGVRVGYLPQEPQLLLLDEIVAGMTREEKEDIARFTLDIRDEFGIAVLMIEHDMQVVMDLSDRVYVLDFGRLIAEGTPAEVAANPAVLAAYLGEEADLA